MFGISAKKKITAICCLVLMIIHTEAFNLKNETGNPDQINKKTTILRTVVSASVLPAGSSLRLTYKWDAKPLDKNCRVWVQIIDSFGIIVLNDDHDPPYPITTSKWSGQVSYTRLIETPKDLKAGTYKIFAGLFDESLERMELNPGKGVTEGENLSYQVGMLTIDDNAPKPSLDSDSPESLNLESYELTFSDEFDEELDVSAWGPGTKWIAHTPYNGDFGDSDFVDPRKDFPFHISDGILNIEARKDSSGKWESGLLCSVDTKGNGFSQQYGYFEMKAKFPKGPGTWPAFWLLALQKLTDRNAMGFEVDIVEQYGRRPAILHTVLHWWYPDRTHKSVGNKFAVEDMYKAYHTYGFLWDEQWMIWYFDGVELWRQSTPEESKTPMYVLLDLALGPGWPIDNTPNPSVMMVDYVRVYSKQD